MSTDRAEAYLLGWMIRNPSIIPEVIAGLPSSDIYSGDNQRIAQHLYDLNRYGADVNYVTLGESLWNEGCIRDLTIIHDLDRNAPEEIRIQPLISLIRGELVHG